MRRRILLFILIGFYSVDYAQAQQPLSATSNTVSVSNTGTSKFYYANRNDPPRAIEFKERTVSASYFLTNINLYFNIPAEFTFMEAESNTDNLGMKHRLLQQYYKGIPLEGLGYRMHEKDGFITAANGKAVQNIKINTQTAIGEEQAFHIAVQYLNAKDTIFRNGRKLIVSRDFTFTSESFSVAFQFDIDVSLIERWRISVDARSGQVINKVSLVNSCRVEKEPTPLLPYGVGTGLTNYYGIQNIKVEKFENSSASRLVGRTASGVTIGTYDFRNAGVIFLTLLFEYSKAYDFYSSDNTYTSQYQKPAVSVQWAAEQAYEYYLKKHNRNSFDNNGGAIKSYVHVDKDLNNAFWTGKLLAFGDGSNNNPLVELDVVGHELTHGVTQYEARLQYSNEPGALNESFSDILGKAVEFDVFGDTATWQIGKHYQVGGLRDISNPNLKNQPDTYAGDMWYAGYEDYGGVHTNSGVQNFWFYLLCEGGSGTNDHQVNYSVNAVGMDVAAKIAYRNLTEYLSSSSDYLDSRIGSLLATADLYGKSSAIYQEVDKAWDAVGVIDEPIITSLEIYDITGTTVKLKGNLLPRGDHATYHFEYGTTPSFGSSSAVYQYTNKVEGTLTGLQSKTKYYLRLVGTNENGNSFYTSEFTTISLAPLVKIKQTVDVTETTAILHGEINPNSLSTSFYFQYGPTPALGFVTPTYPLSDTTEFLKVSATVINLQPRQTYYYRLVATNGFASTTSGPVSFFTAVKPVISSYTPFTAPIGAVVTIIGQNFNSEPEKNLVSFGATRGTVLSSSSTEIKVKVPAGASLGPISLLDAETGLTVESVREFVPTFTGGFKKGSLLLTMGIADIYVYQTFVQDMDGDNKPDIVARHYLGFSVLQNVNQGGDISDQSFNRNTFNGEYTPETLSLVDLDGNGLKDIVVTYQNVLRIYPNLSVPGYVFFGAPVEVSAEGVSDFTFNDFDQDGHIDIAGIIHSGDYSTLTIFRNQNPEGFISRENFVKQFSMSLPYYVYYLYNDDLNNDGRPEFFASAYNQSFVPILINNSRPGVFDFEPNVNQNLNPDQRPRHLAQDLNQDGWKDIISHSSSEIANLIVFENTHSPSTVTLANSVVALSGYPESHIQLGDLDGDGNVDLMVGTNTGKFILLKNKTAMQAQLLGSSFEKFAEFTGASTDISNLSSISINDLNGDGKPEVINTYSYSRFLHDGYQMEIWQHSPSSCLDPALVGLEVSNNTATIVLPPNTTMDQFEIDYSTSNASYWNQVSSPTLSLLSGYSYRLRVRAKCFLGFTDYYYIDFKTDCVDTNSFSISNVGINDVTLTASNLGSLEVQYSLAGKDQWQILPQSSKQINNLLPGTTYDLRFRGRCYSPAEFKNKRFTTLCPKLSTLTITDLRYNKATANWTSNYTGKAILEYSADNVTWILVDETRTMFPLIPVTQYFVRGRMACTDINSDFSYAAFTTPCPKVSSVAIDAVTPFAADVSWVDESDADNYILTYSMSAGGTVTTVETRSTSFRLDGLNPGVRYTVAVAPQCLNAKDFTSTSFSTVCYVPFNLSANAISHTAVELSWKDTFGALPYSIDYSIYGSNIWLTTETPLTNISLTELRPGTEYEARVHINCLSETAPFVSLLFETDLYDETTLVPNPTESKITLRPSKDVIGNRFIVLDNTGKIVIQGELLDYTIDLSDFSAGLYILRIDGEKPIKIVKH